MRDTSRRSLLAAFSALPAATVAAALPSPVLARPAAHMAHVDANLIAAARLVSTWARLDQEAEIRLVEAEDRRDGKLPDNGHAEAERLSRWIVARLVRSAEALAGMPAQTWPGAVAKAQAFQAIQAVGWEHCAVEWRDKLANSIAADVLRIGTGAA